MVPVVLAPQVSYADVAGAFADWDGGATDLNPWLGGEPLSARWHSNGLEVSYSANPTLGLRVLDGSGLKHIAALPNSMTVDDALRLADSADLAQALLGITALGLLGDPATLPELEQIGARRAAEPGIAGAAKLAIQRIGRAALLVGSARVGERRKLHPEQDPVLGLLRPVSARRQVLRTFLTEPPQDRTRLLEVVQAALADADWEVRWTAVLGAHDQRLPEVLPAIRRCACGPDASQRPLLEALRDVIGHRLAGSSSAIPGAAHIEALLDDRQVVYDDAFLLVTALRRPIPDETNDPAPEGFSYVMPIPHWLGTSQTGVRRNTPEAPYAIATAPIPDVAREQVQETLSDLERAGQHMRLPSPDELEMATRGPDGRRFPWGNARESGWRRAVSPWGLIEPLRAAEWVAVDGTVLAMPQAHHGCGLRPVPAQRAAVRAVVGE